MKLMLVGSDHIWSLEKIYYQYLKEDQVDVHLFPIQNFFYEYYESSVINKMIYRAGLSGIIKKINKKLQRAINDIKPDVIWVFKGMEITTDSLARIKAQNILLINYNPDNPFIFSGLGSGNKNVKDSISLYDLHFTYNLEVKLELEKKYSARVVFLPFGFDVKPDLYEKAAEQKEINKVCFLGNPDKERVDIIRTLLEKGISFDVYGHDWKKFINHKNLNIYGPVYGDEFWKILRRYRIQINLLRKHNLKSHNMRTFEIPAIGGIQLAPETPEHRFFFKPEKEIFLFQNINDCYNKIIFLLNLSASESGDIRTQARCTSLVAGYSYKDRSRFVLNIIANMEQEKRKNNNEHV